MQNLNPNIHLFAGSQLNDRQKASYLEAKASHNNKEKKIKEEGSIFSQIFNREFPGEEPIVEVKRDGEVNAGAFINSYPVNPGHALIIPKRTIRSIFETTPQEREDLWTAMVKYKKELENALVKKGLPIPGSYNIGINDGFEAGQSVPHLHIHLIPRYTGDVPRPWGGVSAVKGAEEDFPYQGKTWAPQKYDPKRPMDKSGYDIFKEGGDLRTFTVTA